MPHVVVQSLSSAQLFVTPWTSERQASLSFTISQRFVKLRFVESVIPSNHLILCHHLLLLPAIFPNIKVFSNESTLCIRWPRYWSFSISLSSVYSGFIPFRFDWLDLLAVQGTSKRLPRDFSSTTIWKHQFFCTQPSLWSNYHIHKWLLEKP